MLESVIEGCRILGKAEYKQADTTCFNEKENHNEQN